MCKNEICKNQIPENSHKIKSNIQIVMGNFTIQNKDCADCNYFEFEEDAKGWCTLLKKHVGSAGACKNYTD